MVRWQTTLLAALALAGCGSDGDDGSAAVPPTPTATAKPTATPLPGQPGHAARANRICAAAADGLPGGRVPTGEAELTIYAQREIAALLEAAGKLEAMKKPQLQGVSNSLRELAAGYQQLVTPGLPAEAARAARERIALGRTQVRLAAQDARVPACALR